MGIGEPKMPTPEELANTQKQDEILEPEIAQEKTNIEASENEKKKILEKTISIMKEILNVLPDEEYLMEQYGAHSKRGDYSSMVEIGQLMALRADLSKCFIEFMQRNQNISSPMFTAGIDFPHDSQIDSWKNYLSNRNMTNFFAKQQTFEVQNLLQGLRETCDGLKEQQEI